MTEPSGLYKGSVKSSALSLLVSKLRGTAKQSRKGRQLQTITQGKGFVFVSSRLISDP